MSWPLDARYKSFTPLNTVDDDFLDAVQDAVVDLHRVRILPITRAGWKQYSPGAGDYRPEWYFDTDAPENGWICQNAGGAIVFPVPIPDGCHLQIVRAKVKNTAAATMDADLYEIDHQIEAATTAPTKGSSIASDSAAGSGAWDTLTLDLTDQEMVDYRQVVLEIINATANDVVAAVYAQYEPITPTP